TSYAYDGLIFAGTGGGNFWGSLQRYPASISDGTSNTIFFTEKLASCNPATDPGGELDVGLNFWPDWGPILNDPSASNLVGPLCMFQIGVPSGQTNCFLPSSPHTGGINVALGDGSVRFVTQGISATTWAYAMTPSGGEVLGPDW